jgi:hypothetical protein
MTHESASNLDNRALDRALAEASGWRMNDVGGHEKWIDSSSEDWRCLTCGNTLPRFTTDLNALRDGPERVLREAGWAQRVIQVNGARGCFWDAEWWTMQGDLHEASAPTEARARAEAALMAYRG